MITHYRHTHITSWNKCWGDQGNRYRQSWFGDYDQEKELVNERAKRQIFRKAKEFILANSITISDLEGLEYNSPETLTLANKVLTQVAKPSKKNTKKD